MTLKVFTDAGFKDGVSTHHWRVFDDNGKRIKRRTFLGYEEEVDKAEMQTINHVLQWLIRKNYHDVIIYTDSLNCVRLLNNNINKDNYISFMNWQMKGNNIQVSWKSRETTQIRKADYYCSELQDTVLRRKEFALA